MTHVGRLPSMRSRLSANWLVNFAGLVFAMTVFAMVNFASVADSLRLLLSGAPVYDWVVFQEAVDRIGTGTMYEWGDGYRHRYPPLFAHAIAPFVAMGLTVWRLLHFAALLLLPWRLALIVMVTFPFWYDVAHAGPMTFALVLAFLALRGSRIAFFAFLLMALLMPRPLMVPVIAWMLWKHPGWRWPVVGVAAVYVVLTLATGELLPFLAALPGSSDAFAYPSNWGPTRFIGWAGVPVSLALGAWLTWNGRLGLASVAISPYIVPYYWIMLLLEMPRRLVDAPRSSRVASSRTPTISHAR